MYFDAQQNVKGAFCIEIWDFQIWKKSFPPHSSTFCAGKDVKYDTTKISKFQHSDSMGFPHSSTLIYKARWYQGGENSCKKNAKAPVILYMPGGRERFKEVHIELCMFTDHFILSLCSPLYLLILGIFFMLTIDWCNHYPLSSLSHCLWIISQKYHLLLFFNQQICFRESKSFYMFLCSHFPGIFPDALLWNSSDDCGGGWGPTHRTYDPGTARFA